MKTCLIVMTTALLLSAGCERPTTAQREPPKTPTAIPEQRQDLMDVAKRRMPDVWTGSGTLRANDAARPKAAPAWTATSALVVIRDGARYLRTVGVARGIRNEALAQSAALARARAEMGLWLGREELVLSREVRRWSSGEITIVQAEIPVPEDWSGPPT